MNQIKREELQKIIDNYRNESSSMPNQLETTYSQGNLLKELRVELEVPQKAIAKKIGITPPTLSAHEKKHFVNTATLDKYLECISMTERDFFLLLKLLSNLGLDLNGMLTMNKSDLDEMVQKKQEKYSIDIRQKTLAKLDNQVSRMDIKDINKVIDYAEMVNDQNFLRMTTKLSKIVPKATWSGESND
ncbi:helix-turn-helix domain-containing protein [Ileibacterium valens]|uniref:helix-turn-helix domain-containing protein n=1 Tax=Ileibacterium valens TaxID=1862668 RepID=UPI002729E75A|nr:helix-turn-helix transcriptional regulator [Ileibacterium valens]